MLERGLGFFVPLGQRHPALDAVDANPSRACFGAASLGVHDAASGQHPVDVAGADDLHRAEAVAVHEIAVEEVRHRREADVRVRSHVDAFAGHQLGWPHLIEEDERADQSPLR